MPDRPEDPTRQLAAEATWARGLVVQVAEALERAAGQHQAVAGQLRELEVVHTG